MNSNHFSKIKTGEWFRKNRFHLLLPATLIVLFIPAFFNGDLLSEILFFSAFSFLFIQSMYAATGQKVKKPYLRLAIVFLMILVLWTEPAGVHLDSLKLLRILMFIGFFLFIIYSLSRFLFQAKTVNVQVILITINIYLLMGLIFGNISLLLYQQDPAAYRFPEYITKPAFVDFVYYSFITMSTVGYGDITPAIRQSQFFAYLTAITGQLYVAVVLGIIIGKYLVESAKQKA
ncbi:MAG: two pore domain potassium channel family protein [Bacteroidetes bacterium]|nr:two pore domain potassium channel family protein [Bacteroidota bacterium]